MAKAHVVFHFRGINNKNRSPWCVVCGTNGLQDRSGPDEPGGSDCPAGFDGHGGSGDLDGRGSDGRRGSGMAILPDLRPPVVASAPAALVIFVVVAAQVPSVPVVL